MPPSPIPAPLPPWARALLQLAPLISAGLQEVLQYIHELGDNTSASNSVWQKVVFRWHQPTNTDVRDEVITTMDIVNITGGTVDDTWTAADFNTVDGALKTLMDNWTANMPASWTGVDRRYYRMQFNPMTLTKPFPPTGGPVHTVADGTSGGHTTQQAPQIALTSTDKTAYRRHWGRNYWPIPAADFVGTDMHATSDIVQALVNSLSIAYGALGNAEFFPVVPVTQYQPGGKGTPSLPLRGLLTVTDVTADNVFDVIRRRRSRSKTFSALANASGIFSSAA